MSSLIRRLAIRMMKRGGFTREKWIIVKGETIQVKRGGEITDPDDTPIGRLWPTVIPARCKAASRPLPSATAPFVPFALRRSKRSRQWLEARAKANGEQVHSDPLPKEVGR